ncbi:hypothetical protein U9M48_000651, partial [Paspalum notatum var. saurae]
DMPTHAEAIAEDRQSHLALKQNGLAQFHEDLTMTKEEECKSSTFCPPMKRRDDEELEVVQQRLSRNPTPNRTPVHTSVLSGKKHVEEHLRGHKVRVRRELRMEKEIFCKLVELLHNSHLLSNARDITVEEYNRLLREQFQHSGETISRYFNIVLQAIVSLPSKIIKLPPINTPFLISSNP